jgi:hypothetical protein
MVDVRDCFAYDACDHVYGIAGLYKKVFASQLLNAITPDYTKPLSEVMQDVTIAIIKQTRNLFVLR